MNDQELRKLLKKLQVIMRCPNCGKRYIPEEIAMRGFIEQTYFLHLDCSNCHVPIFATIAISSDVNKEVVEENRPFSKDRKHIKENFKKQDSTITNSDIQEFSQFIDNFSGSFSQGL